MKTILLVLLVAIALGATDYKQMVRDINSRNGLWKARVPTNIEHYKSSLGARLDGKRMNFKYIHPHASLKLPKSFNPIEKWPMCSSLVEIRDQSVCGSCWAFGAVEAATDRLCIHSNGTHQERLSSSDMLSCCDSCGFGCSGGFPYEAWQWMYTEGVVTGDLYGDKKYCYPYAFPECDHHVNGTHGPCGDTQPTPDCVRKCQDGYSTPYKQDKRFFLEPYSIPNNEEAIMAELYENGPIEVAFTVYEDFMTYSKGIYQHVTGQSLGGHAVKMVGWGEEGGVKYWTIANSWNEDWGEKGYFRIIRGKNECGMEAQGVAGMPKL